MTAKYRVVYLPAASDDMDDLYSYIAFQLREKETAKRLLHRLYQSIRSLDVFPERYPKVDWEPWASLEMRKMSVDRYVVYYRVDTERKAVEIVRIFYGGRDIESIAQAEEDRSIDKE